MANDLDFSVAVSNSERREGWGRSVFVHEFGHALGFLHESGHSVMRETTPLPLTGGAEPSTLWPSDAVGLDRLYSIGSFLPNLIASAQGVEGAKVRLLNRRTDTVCRAERVAVRFYVGNAGKGPSGSYGIRVRLNNTTVATFTRSLPAFSGTIVALPFTVPYSAANGRHEIFIDLGPDGAVNELREGDNTTVSGLALQVAC